MRNLSLMRRIGLGVDILRSECEADWQRTCRNISSECGRFRGRMLCLGTPVWCQLVRVDPEEAEESMASSKDSKSAREPRDPIAALDSSRNGEAVARRRGGEQLFANPESQPNSKQVSEVASTPGTSAGSGSNTSFSEIQGQAVSPNSLVTANDVVVEHPVSNGSQMEGSARDHVDGDAKGNRFAKTGGPGSTQDNSGRSDSRQANSRNKQTIRSDSGKSSGSAASPGSAAHQTAGGAVPPGTRIPQVGVVNAAGIPPG